ncbi:MAG TPA: SpoIID/LytB domain-containing protein [Gemmatimonadales bacterium]|nr:SpoIID/LytB domain-containing protein [Gemmatimonadales bacterium]
MTRWPRRALASAALAGLLGCPHPGAPTPATEPEFRVGLEVGVPSATLGGDAELFVIDDGNGSPVGSIPAGVSWKVLTDTGGLVLERADGSRSEPHHGISAVGVTEGRFAQVNGRRYRGRINIFRDAGGLTVMNRLGAESYLAGVVGLEMGPRKPGEEEAMISQVVVSRTFAIRNRGRWEALGFDMYDDTRDQVYGGVAAETPQVWAAIKRSTGQVLEYHGNVIEAYFSSTCGGRTAGVEEVFKTAASEPYLKSVSDDAGGGHYFCDISPRFRWREEWDGASLRAILSRTLPQVSQVGGGGLQRIADLEVSQRTRSGRVGELDIQFEHGDIKVPGPDVRSVLRPDAGRVLNSQLFDLDVTHQDGEVSKVVAEGRGSGHGIGLCQWGAVGRARAGQNYQRILATYFPGTKLARLY